MQEDAEAMRRMTRLPALPDRPAGGHKGLFGKVLVIGGSEGMIGAPAFAAMAALRSGCGLAYVATDRRVLPFVQTVVPEAVGIPLISARDARLRAAIESADAVAVGPGLGQSSVAAGLLKVAMQAAAPLVIDADALNLIAAGKVKLERPPLSAVLTPHPGEMLRLGRLFGVSEVREDDDGRIEVAMVAARHFGQVVLLKGERTVITDGKRYAVNATGDSTLAKAGSGDILSGMIATLLAQKMIPFEAAWLGAHYHGKAGEYAGTDVTRRGALAREVVDAIPFVMDRPE